MFDVGRGFEAAAVLEETWNERTLGRIWVQICRRIMVEVKVEARTRNISRDHHFLHHPGT